MMNLFSSRALYSLLASICIVMSLLYCRKVADEKVTISTTTINTAHLDALYAEKKVGDDTVGIVHIYSEYPDYHMVDDGDEGSACVDDASRAAVFYLRHYQKTNSPEHLHKGKMLIRFMLAMQAPNGYYYNFIWPDGSIHKDGITTKPEPSFWAWRTLWAFGEAIAILDANDPLVTEIKNQRSTLVKTMLNEQSFRSDVIDTTMGWPFPTWLPGGSGTDQASIMLLGLARLNQQLTAVDSVSKDTIRSFMQHLTDGITMMQITEPDSMHNGAFLSWENLWHAYGNIQSYALIIAGRELDDPHLATHAIYEIDHFFHSFLSAGGLDHFFIRVDDGKVSRYDVQPFSQIAYHRSPMVLGALEAYKETGDEKYVALAKDLMSWFTGKNPANTPMYDPLTGRGYDGISSADQINKNSGAESTIEALLSLQAMEMYLK